MEDTTDVKDKYQAMEERCKISSHSRTHVGTEIKPEGSISLAGSLLSCNTICVSTCIKQLKANEGLAALRVKQLKEKQERFRKGGEMKTEYQPNMNSSRCLFKYNVKILRDYSVSEEQYQTLSNNLGHMLEELLLNLLSKPTPEMLSLGGRLRKLRPNWVKSFPQ